MREFSARIILVVFLIVAPAASVIAQDAIKKRAVPTDAAQVEATKLIKEVYGDEYARAETAAQKQALAKKLLAKATQTSDDPAGQFVLLRLAKDIATRANDGQTAFGAIDRMAGAFRVDANELKTVVLSKLASAAQNPGQHRPIAEQALALTEDAIAADTYKVAEQIAAMALDESRKAGDPALISNARAKQDDVAERARAYERAGSARATLEKTPNDADANSVLGSYLCLAKGDWSKGLPLLALAKDAGLRAIAQNELANPTSSTEQARLGDGWWSFADQQQGIFKKQSQRRACYWYQKALPGLSGLTKDKVEKRLSKVAEAQAPAPVAGETTGARPPMAIAPFNEKIAKQHQTQWARFLGVPVVQANSIGMKLALIPPGEFQMGSPKKLIEEELRLHGGIGWYREHLPSEGPQHRVRMTEPFWLGVAAVTQEQYQRVMGSNPSKYRGNPRKPVEQVSWNDASEFCRKLSELPGEKATKRRYGLPTEAQWEYACRAGNTGRWYFSAQPNPFPLSVEEKLLREYAWFNTAPMTHPVAQKRPNAWGLYDMNGNVWQWCRDWFDKDYYVNSPSDDPSGPPEGSRRVKRGGCWDPACTCRSANRNDAQPGDRADHLGFRVYQFRAEN